MLIIYPRGGGQPRYVVLDDAGETSIDLTPADDGYILADGAVAATGLQPGAYIATIYPGTTAEPTGDVAGYLARPLVWDGAKITAPADSVSVRPR